MIHLMLAQPTPQRSTVNTMKFQLASLSVLGSNVNIIGSL